MRNERFRALISIPVVLLLLGAAESAAQLPPGAISARDADRYFERVKTVCGLVVHTKVVTTGRQPILLDLDEPYPRNIFTIVIYRESLQHFAPRPERTYDQQKVCVTGKIIDYKGTPEIVIEKPSMIRIQKP